MKIETRFDYMKEEELTSRCPFCNADINRVIYRGKNFFVMVDVGALMLGHCLIIPYSHERCFGELKNELSNEMIELKNNLRNILIKEYEPQTVLTFEHGHIGNAVQRTMPCKHAHLHNIPVMFNESYVEFIKKDLGISPIVFFDFFAFRNYMEDNNIDKQYYYVEEENKAFVFFPESIELPEHYLRHCYLKLNNNVLEYSDWTKHPQWNNVNETIERLSNKVGGALLL